MTRRDLLIGAGATGLLAGCGPGLRYLQNDHAPAPPLPTPERRLLDRVVYGPSDADAKRLTQLGSQAFLDAQLRGDFPEPTSLTIALRRLDALDAEPYDLRDRPEDEILGQIQSAALLKATLSANGLRARMEEFWADWFNVYARKGLATYRLAAYHRSLGDPLGRFRDLLRAALASPAMTAYLDGQLNVAKAPNENLARELLELHTLGVGGGYTQKDVMEVARCLTGWTLENRPFRRRGTLVFVPESHDDGPKLVLGHRIPRGLGAKDRDAVLDIVATHPATAQRIARTLAARFHANPSPDLIKRATKAFQDSHGDLRTTLRPILDAQALAQDAPLTKRPFEVVVSALRAVGARTDAGPELRAHLARMGHAPYEWPMPDGYPAEPEAWRGGVLPRWRFALALANNDIAGTETPTPDPKTLLASLYPRDVDHPALRHPSADAAALLLMDPRFVLK